MKTIVRDIHNAVQNSRNTIEFLLTQTSRNWLDNFPVALIHDKNRITDATELTELQTLHFFNADGFSKENYTTEELRKLQEMTPYVTKNAYCICLKKDAPKTFSFKEKYHKDKWKKVQDVDHNFDALVEFSKFSNEDTSVTIETQIRDIMRSAKEIPSLKATGFIWILSVPKTTYVRDILEHYFGDNHIYVERGRKMTYIAWADLLSGINMRYFVNTP